MLKKYGIKSADGYQQMENSNQNGSNVAQNVLQQLWNEAVAALTSAVSLTEAEPEMLRLLQCIKAHPEQRLFVVRLFVESLSDRGCPWEMVQFCMYDLRWSEVRAYVEGKRLEARDIDEASFWLKMLKAFDDDWEDAEFFQAYRNCPNRQ